MVDLHFLFFQLAPALQFIFKISHIPQEVDFKELTPAQYNSFYSKASEEDLNNLAHQRLLAFLPDDARVYNRVVNLYGDDLALVGAKELAAFKYASEYIDKCCNESGREFETLSDKLVYMAQMLPAVFTEGTPYALHGKRKNLHP